MPSFGTVRRCTGSVFSPAEATPLAPNHNAARFPRAYYALLGAFHTKNNPKSPERPDFCACFAFLYAPGIRPPRSKAPASQRKFAAVCAVRRYAKAGCHSSWRANPFGFAEACRRAGTACSKFRAIKRCGPLCGKLPTYGIFLCFAHFQQSVH